MNVVVIPAIRKAEDRDDGDANSDDQLNEQFGNLQETDAAAFYFSRHKNAAFIFFANDFCHLGKLRTIEEDSSLS